jgi:transcriptional regulator with XRE-family HTH domain
MANKLESRIKESRKSIGYSQRRIAELLNIAFQTQNKYEKGHRTPNAKYLQRFIAITRCDPGWLLTGKASEDPTLRISEAPVGYGFTEEEDEYVKKLVKILRTKQSGTVIAIKQSVDTFLTTPDKEAPDTLDEVK